MSGATQDPLDPVAEAEKVEKYSYLLPFASPLMIAKIASGVPGGTGGTALSPDPRAAALRAPDWPALAPAAARDRAIGCFLGLAVGDAIGGAVEFKPRDSFPPVTDMAGGGPFSLAPGEWTDDTTMALCLAQSLLECGTVDQDDLMTRFRGWLERGENTVRGTCFDIGATTRAAIQSYVATGFAAAGSEEGNTAGNGSLVRLAPLAIFAAGNREGAEFLAQKQSRTTHGAWECLDACKLFISQLLDALSGADKEGATRQRVMSLSSKLLFISAGEWKHKTREQIHSSGYVVHTLEAALWSVWQTDNFRDAVLLAANLGDNADSAAAVAGQLAGALYGAKTIPSAWLRRLAWRDRIEKMAKALFDRNRGAG
ncbi:MAG TPA: ADP-ribosylglycohydrolase family protein [Acetobacteraceae bacterium]|nr:ADP-ribosylglycohydrolase family protein [Acetobacteraceae bacterium]